jgi:imidazolonepropionase-like amidohydrolase
MKKHILSLLILAVVLRSPAQENIYPVPAHKGITAITGAIIHIGNGTVINNGTLLITDDKITGVGDNQIVPSGATVIRATGKHIYPGIIAMCTNLGLAELSSIRASSDHTEIGNMNPNIQSIMAYNAESKVIPTVRSNGILLAHIVPRGGTISGTSSIVQLDAWNWNDAVYKMNNGIHLNLPAMINRPGPFGNQNANPPSSADVIKNALMKTEEIRIFFREAKAYLAVKEHTATNLKYEAVKGLFDQSQKLFVHCDLVKEMMTAIGLKQEFGFDVVIIGGADSWLIAESLKEFKVPVILSEPHSLPSTPDDAVDLPYKTGAILQAAGVLYSISIEQNHWQQRCLPFQAGTMAAYGLTKEQALSSITLNAAKILGIEGKTGSLEAGKDANLVISEGDILDMKSSIIMHAFIQGRMINLDNKQTQLYEKYKYKYGLK